MYHPFAQSPYSFYQNKAAFDQLPFSGGVLSAGAGCLVVKRRFFVETTGQTIFIATFCSNMSTVTTQIMAFFRIRWVRILANIVAWLLPITLLPVYSEAEWKTASWDVLSLSLIYCCFSCFAAAFYLNAFLLVPRLLGRRKYGWFTLAFIAVFFLFYPMFKYTVQLSGAIAPNVHAEIYFKLWYKRLGLVSYYAPYYVILVLLPLLLKFFRDHYTVTNRITQLQQQHTELELNFLKAQLNPHFMFNSLNNIYSLSLHQSSATPAIVLKLSDLLRYTLYETKDSLIGLDREIQFIKDYIDLEKIRHGDHVKIDIDIQGNPAQQQVAPLLLVPFIENSFKHGVNAQFGNAWIKLQLHISGNELHFVLRNNMPGAEEKKYQLNKAGGIGLQNTRKRLALLYPNRHRLNITEHDDVYEVALTLQLNQPNHVPMPHS